MRPPSLTASQIARLLTVVSFLGSLAANVATGSLPEAWRPHLWWAWPITGLFLLLTVGLTVAERDEESQLQRQRGLALKQIQAHIKQALDSRLPDRNQRIPLHLTSQPRAVMPRPGLRPERPAQPAQRVRPEKRIDEVFRDASYALLILGAPGAGKTTLLLELAEALAEKAEHDPQAPLPIVLSLDSWAQQKGDLEDWFAREASRVYGIGITLAQRWLEKDALLPLLDGFDEVARERREDCARAINRFRERHGMLPIAVCSRKAEYDKLEGRDLLALTGAVVVEPLTHAQITEYLKAGGARLAGLAQARASVPALRELLTTPLMLSVAASAFADRGRQALPFAGADEAQAQLWAAYVRRMLGRARRGRDAGADDRRRLRYLAWLAGAMAERGLSVFYIERLQPDWLPQRAAGTYRLLAGPRSRW
jgi:energy-coupling factor transporter ATP-binding protein EcfA2